MSYNVKNSSGQTITTIPDRHIDTDATSLSLVGYQVSDYGLAHNENFVRLLENHSNTIPPENPVQGQLWFDKGSEILNVYSSNQWVPVSATGTPSIGGNAFENGLSGAYHLALSTTPPTSILLLFAAGKIISALADRDIGNVFLPAGVEVEGTQYPLSVRFPYGLKAGQTLAFDSQDYEFAGRVAVANQSIFAGGGDSNKPAGFTFMDLGADTIGLMIANGRIIAATAEVAIANNFLPNTVTVSVALSDGSQETTSVLFRSAFPSGLNTGITYANGFSRYGNDVLIAAIAGMGHSANQGLYFAGTNNPATYALSPFGRSLAGAGDAAAARSILGVATTSALLNAISALTPLNNEGMYFTGNGGVAPYVLTPYGRSLTASPDAASARNTLGELINAFGSLSTSDNLGMYFTGSNSISTFPLSALGRVIMGSQTQEDARNTIGGVGAFGVANTSDIIAGTSSDRVVTPAALSGLPRSMTTNGYKMFQDGFIIQWGRITSGNGEVQTTQSFPYTFPNNCFAAIPVTINSTAHNEHDYNMQIVYANNSQISVFHQSPDSDSAASTGYYIAIGN